MMNCRVTAWYKSFFFPNWYDHNLCEWPFLSWPDQIYHDVYTYIFLEHQWNSLWNLFQRYMWLLYWKICRHFVTGIIMISWNIMKYPYEHVVFIISQWCLYINLKLSGHLKLIYAFLVLTFCNISLCISQECTSVLLRFFSFVTLEVGCSFIVFLFSSDWSWLHFHCVLFCQTSHSVFMALKFCLSAPDKFFGYLLYF